MNELIEKLQRVECRISRDRGPFTLFALFRTESAPGLWDLVIAAPWADERDWEARRYVRTELHRDLTPRERLEIDRVMVVPSDFADIAKLSREHPVEHGRALVLDREFGLQTVEKGYLITCRPPVAKAA